MSSIYSVTFRSALFPILEGEDEEIVNPGTYGKALALYLQSNLEEKGYTFRFMVCEDFGWWLEFKDTPISLGVICSRSPMSGEEEIIYCGLSKGQGKYWQWRKLRYIDASEFIKGVERDLSHIIHRIEDIELIDETFSGTPQG